MNRGLLILFAPIVVPSCKKHRLVKERALLEGKWKWVYTRAFVSLCDPPSYVEYYTPLTEGIHYSVKMKKNGKIEFYENDNLLEAKRIIFECNDDPKCDQSLLENGGFYIDLNNNDEDPFQGYVWGDSLRITYGFT